MNEEDRRSAVQATRMPEFWETMYREERTGWDLGNATPALRAALDLGLLAGLPRVLVPGAGRGWDAIELARRGHEVTAIDFAQSAIDAMRLRAEEASVSLNLRAQDLFDADDLETGSFDAVYEYTCYVAIDPALRDDWARLMTRLVRPGGRLLFLAFPLGRTEPGPPHGLTIHELRKRFDGAWRWLLDTEPAVSVEGRRGMERLVLLERRR